MNKTKFTFTLVAKGWSDSAENHNEPPNKVKILKVRPISLKNIFLFLLLWLRECLACVGQRHQPGVWSYSYNVPSISGNYHK